MTDYAAIAERLVEDVTLDIAAYLRSVLGNHLQGLGLFTVVEEGVDFPKAFVAGANHNVILVGGHPADLAAVACRRAGPDIPKAADSN